MKFENKKSTASKYEYKGTDSLISDVKEYTYAIIYKLDGVEILKATKKVHLDGVEMLKDTYELHLDEKSLDEENFLELRAFNRNKELRVAYINGKYIGRTRIDGEGEDIEIVDECHLLWGKPQKQEGKYTYLSEDRGVELRLPLKVEGNERAFVTVRNYLNPDKNVFEFNDYRMVDFIAKEAAEYDEKEEK